MFVEANPMSQFELKRYLPLEFAGYDLSFTNSALFMAGIVAGIVAVVWVATQDAKLVPGRLQSVVEILYNLIRDMVSSVVGEGGRPFFPFVFTLFIFILIANLVGMSPFAFTVTSHLSVTAALGLLVIFIVLSVGLSRQGMGFFARFWPANVPIVIAPLIALIEVISFLIRPATLGVRLFANMLAGHTMLKILAGFVPVGLGLGAAGGLFSTGPGGLIAAAGSFFGVIAVTALEFMVAGLQAYVFAILTCVYLSEVVNDPHH